jgi:GT2 family glycosyltransferase
VTIVIVVYRIAFIDTISYKSLVQALSLLQWKDYVVIIYDNTDILGWNTGLNLAEGLERVHYYHNAENGGVSAAYNYAARIAEQRNDPWILLLDQDTMLPDCSISCYLNSILTRPDLLIKAPRIRVNEKLFSPLRFWSFKTFSKKTVQHGEQSLKKYKIINSGMLVSLNMFQKVGGYNERIKLDFSDEDFVNKIRYLTSRFEVLDFDCSHDFSLTERNLSKALDRYKHYLSGHRELKKDSFSECLTYTIVHLIHLFKLTVMYQTTLFFSIWLKNRGHTR